MKSTGKTSTPHSKNEVEMLRYRQEVYGLSSFIQKRTMNEGELEQGKAAEAAMLLHVVTVIAALCGIKVMVLFPVIFALTGIFRWCNCNDPSARKALWASIVMFLIGHMTTLLFLLWYATQGGGFFWGRIIPQTLILVGTIHKKIRLKGDRVAIKLTVTTADIALLAVVAIPWERVVPWLIV